MGPHETEDRGASPLLLALKIHRDWESGGRRESPAELLEKHPGLRDFLAPLLAEEETPAAVSADKRLGGYRIIREIGRGGMGVVYLAWEEELNRRVALKVLPAHLTLQPAAVARFRREALTAAGLDHPGLVRVYAVGDAEEAHYFAMEFIAGAPLSKVLEQAREKGLASLHGVTIGTAISATTHQAKEFEEEIGEHPTTDSGRTTSWHHGHVETVLGLAIQVADALGYAHDEGVVHRDVKPSNILVREEGTAVLTDFGLAREAGIASMTMTGDFVGTPYYVSPEQAAGRHREVDHRSDIFSLGVTLYELLTLVRPFAGETNQEVLQRITTKEPRDPRRHNPKLTPDLVAIVMKALEKNPARRYQSMEDLSRDLRAYLHYRPITARPASWWSKLLKWTRREPLQAGLAATLLLGVPTVAGLGGYALAKQREIAIGKEVIHDQQLQTELAEAHMLLFEPDGTGRAKMTFDAILDREPDNQEALMGLALFYSFTQDKKRLIAHLKKNEKHLQDIRMAQEMALRAQQEWGKGRGSTRVSIVPDARFGHLDYYLLGADTYWEGAHQRNPKRRREGVDMLLKAIALAPTPRVLYYSELAYFAGCTPLRREAELAVAGLACHWPDSKMARVYQAYAWVYLDPEKAVRIFEALEHQGFDGSFIYQHRFIVGLARCGRLGEAQARFNRLLTTRKVADAAKAQVAVLLASNQSRTGLSEQARANYRLAIKLDPSNPQARTNLGKLLLDSSKREGRRDPEKVAEALVHYRKALSAKPDYEIAKSNLYGQLIRDRSQGYGLAEARRAVAAMPDDYQANLFLARALSRNRRSKEATALLEKMLVKFPGRDQIYLQLAILNRKRPSASLYQSLRAALLNPESFYAQRELATVLAISKCFKLALPHMEKAIALRPYHRIVHRNLVLLYSDLGRLRQERDECRRWLGKYPDSVWDLTRLAWSHLGAHLAPDKKEPAQAIPHATRAAELSRWRDPKPILALSEAAWWQGERETCRTFLDRARKAMAATRSSSGGKSELQPLVDSLEKRLSKK